MMLRDTKPLRFPSAVFWHTLRENVAGVLLWGFGYSAIIVLALLLYPVLRENNVLFNLLSGFGVIARFSERYGVNVDAVIGLKGYLAFQVLAWGPLILALYVVPKAAEIVLTEEKRATLDLLLSAPLPRWRLVIEKTLALLLSLAGILMIMWLTLLLMVMLTSARNELSPADARYAVWHLMPISTAITCAGLFVSVLVREVRTTLSIMGAFVLLSFVVRAFADSTRDPRLLDLAQFSIFNYFSDITVLSYGPQPRWDVLLFTVSAILLALAMIAFQRRDIQP